MKEDTQENREEEKESSDYTVENTEEEGEPQIIVDLCKFFLIISCNILDRRLNIRVIRLYSWKYRRRNRRRWNPGFFYPIIKYLVARLTPKSIVTKWLIGSLTPKLIVVRLGSYNKYLVDLIGGELIRWKFAIFKSSFKLYITFNLSRNIIWNKFITTQRGIS